MKVSCKLKALGAFTSSWTAEDENDMSLSIQKLGPRQSKILNALDRIIAVGFDRVALILSRCVNWATLAATVCVKGR